MSGISHEKTPLVDTDIFAERPLDWLPSWAYDGEVANLARARSQHPDSMKGGKLVPFEVAGPALPWALRGTVILWSFFMFFPILVWCVTPCGVDSTGFAQAPSWLFCVFATILAYELYIQWKCLRYLNPMYVQHLGAWQVLGFEVPYAAWMALTYVLSMLSIVEIAAQGVFVARMMKTFHCKDDAEVAVIWAHTMKSSYISVLPGFSDFRIVVVLIWGLMLLQPVWALLAATPMESITYEFGSMSLGYKTLAGQYWHNDVLTELAQVSRMDAVTFRNYDLTFANASRFLEPARRSDKDFVARLSPVLKSAALRFLMYSVLENALKLELQITMLSISRSIEPRTSDFETLFALVFSVITACRSGGQACLLCWRFHREQSRVDGDLARETLQSVDHYSRMNFWLRVFALIIACYAFIIAHAAAKLAMAYVCKYSLWNLSVAESGCVDLSSILSY